MRTAGRGGESIQRPGSQKAEENPSLVGVRVSAARSFRGYPASGLVFGLAAFYYITRSGIDGGGSGEFPGPTRAQFGQFAGAGEQCAFE